MTTKENPLIAAASLAKRLDTLTGERVRAEQDPKAFVEQHFTTERISKLANASEAAVKMLLDQKQVTMDEAKQAPAVRNVPGSSGCSARLASSATSSAFLMRPDSNSSGS